MLTSISDDHSVVFSLQLFLFMNVKTLKTKLQLGRELTPMSSFNEKHQRCQGACQQQDATDARSRASVAVVALATVDVAFK